jgi:hypothetical protein
MIVFAVCIEYVFDDFRVAAAAYTLHDVGATAFLLEAIAIAKLEETEVGIAVADVACNAFQTAEEQCLAQHVKVLAKGIDEANQFFALVGLKPIVVCTTLKAVVKYFVEATTHKLFANDILLFVAEIVNSLDCKAALKGGGYLDVIVSIDGQYVFYNIAGALDI